MLFQNYPRRFPDANKPRFIRGISRKKSVKMMLIRPFVGASSQMMMHSAAKFAVCAFFK